jgi:hypothetical protein
MPARYALSYVPEKDSPLSNFGREWLGRDIDTAEELEQHQVPGVAKERLKELTHWRRSDGLHGVLKPPFHLNPGSSFNGLMDTAHLFAQFLEQVEIPQLEVNIIGKFVALTPTIASRQLVELASDCVRVFEGYRKPIMVDVDSRYRHDKLTVYQKRMLKHWGYPYVMEEFRFFIPLTDRIEDDEERNLITKAITKISKPVLKQPLSIRELTVLGQISRQDPMRIVTRIPFGRA